VFLKRAMKKQKQKNLANKKSVFRFCVTQSFKVTWTDEMDKLW
jgi:hypothetical protein